MRMAQLLATVSILALLGAGVPPAHAADEGKNDAWHFEVTPYVWLPEIQGRVTAAGAGGQSVSTSLHIGMDDSLKLLFKGQLWAGMGYFEARKRRLSLFLDVVGLHAEEAQTVTGRSLGLGVFRNPARTTKIAVFTDVIMTEFGAMYRVLDLPRANERTPSVSIDALAGGRYLHSANDTDLRSTSLLGPVGAEASNTADIVDPFFGGRWAVGLRDDLVLGFRGDVGGFDTGTHFTWQIAGSLRYRLPFTLYATPLWTTVGYRVLDFDIRNTAPCVAARINLQLRGPFAGLVAQF
jgi:hypothetical protein